MLFSIGIIFFGSLINNFLIQINKCLKIEFNFVKYIFIPIPSIYDIFKVGLRFSRDFKVGSKIR